MNNGKNFFRVSAENFKKIPGSPIAYWLSQRISDVFRIAQPLNKYASPRQGLATSDNQRFVRLWFEISKKTIGFNCSNRSEALLSNKKWFPFNKGGTFRRWAGNNELVVNWENDGKAIKTSIISKYPYLNGNPDFVAKNPDFYFRIGLTWSALSSGLFSLRDQPAGFIFADKGQAMFPYDIANKNKLLGLLNSTPIIYFLEAISPTLDFNAGYISKIPVKLKDTPCVNTLLRISQSDWDSYEISWGFQENPLIRERRIWDESNVEVSSLAENYSRLRLDWKRQTEEMHRLEIENNRIFIEAYGLQDELSPEVPWNEITLTCNPWYRYGKKPENADSLGNSFHLNASAAQIDPISKQEESCSDEDFPFAHDTEQRLLEDTIKEYISYAVGCMMGRYSPEKPGLILANQGESIDDYHKKMGNRDENITNGVLYSESTTNLAGTPYTIKERCGFSYHQIIDCDGVIPILDEEWFIDDIVAQFKSFLKFTFGMEHFADNLDFIEKALGKDIRKYFIKDFYKDHVQRYKKRPIYWMFSSPKGSFNALIYMHRYRPDTVSIVLNEYLREFISKIRSHREHLITENNRATLAPAEKTRNLKLIDKYAAMLTELDAYERDILYPLAQQKIAIDLDDGVKVNYCKFGAALKKIPGLEAKEE